MKNIRDLRDGLLKVFMDLKNDTLEVRAASEMNNAAGKIVNTVKVQLEYSALRKEKPAIDFLEVD
jgi:hypothetical protein